MNRLAFVLINATSVIYAGETNLLDLIDASPGIQWLAVQDVDGVQHTVNLNHVMHIVNMDTLPKDRSS